MAPGLVVYDLLYLVLATGLYGGALLAAAEVFTRLSALVPWPVAVGPAVVMGLVTLIAEVGALTLLCPTLKPGRYEMMKGPVFYGWLFRSLLRRLLMFPGVRWLIFTSNVLRFLALRAMGAKVAFTANMSGDVDLLDPSLLTVGPGAVIGAKCFISGHYVDRGRLILGPVSIGARSLLAADVQVGPNVSIGAGVIIKPLSNLGPGSTIGDGADLGGDVLLDLGVTIGAKARIGHRAYLRAGAVVADGEVVEPATIVLRRGGTSEPQ